MFFYQIELKESSRDIATFFTHKGLFRYKRLMFEISNLRPQRCTSVQRIIQQVGAGCEEAHNTLDDIIVHVEDEERHSIRLAKVLDCITKAG